ncbi:MAG: hypothetical protein IKJ40_08000, partial [Bacteroidales bacterium]|nr:hypothetical protein [Bacteroidales bacterium]
LTMYSSMQGIGEDLNFRKIDLPTNRYHLFERGSTVPEVYAGGMATDDDEMFEIDSMEVESIDDYESAIF